MSNAIHNYSDLGWFPLRKLDRLIAWGPIGGEINKQWLNMETFELHPQLRQTFLTQADEAVVATVNSREHSVNVILPEIRKSLDDPSLTNEWAPTYPIAVRAFSEDEWLLNGVISLINHDVSQNPVLVAQILVAIAAVEPKAISECERRLRQFTNQELAQTGVEIIKIQKAKRSRRSELNFAMLRSQTANELRAAKGRQIVYGVG